MGCYPLGMRWSPLLFALALGASLACAGEAREAGPRNESTQAAPSIPTQAPVSSTPGAVIRKGWISLRLPPGVSAKPEHARLAQDLDRAAREMAVRIPLTEPETPITVSIEPDYVSQARNAGTIGEAVQGPPGGAAELYLVHHPDDLFAYRHALAGVLLKRAGLGSLPGWLPDGAALWLSRDWYGRTYEEWVPLLAAARVVPSATDLLPASREEQRAASRVLWTPAAAAVVERLPGSSLKEKLGQAPASEQVTTILARLAAPPAKPPVPSRSASKAQLRKLPFLKGVSFAMLNRLEGGYHAPSVDRQLERLRGLGSNSVSLMPFAAQRDPASPEMVFLNRRPASETDVGLIHAARRARAGGFLVLYKPHIWVSHDSWPGDVAMKSEEDWAAWWERYRCYVLHHAALAAWTRSELFSVGVELSKTTHREKEWRDLIASTRLFYPGLVTYSGNWYGDLEGVAFWDATDLIGIDAYYPLAGSPEAARSELEQGARGIAERLSAASRRHGKPVLLTEVGFASRRAAWVAPHDEKGEYSEEDQALAYEVLFQALGRPRWLAGTFVWKAFSGETGSRGRPDFGFLGRRAEEAVRRYYTAR